MIAGVVVVESLWRCGVGSATREKGNCASVNASGGRESAKNSLGSVPNCAEVMRWKREAKEAVGLGDTAT